MTEKNQTLGSQNQGLSNTIQIKVSHHSKENTNLYDKNENEKKITLPHSIKNIFNTSKNNTQMKGSSIIQNQNFFENKDFEENDENENKQNKIIENNINNKTKEEMILSKTIIGKLSTNKVKFHEFYINNNKKNKSTYNHSNNKISTTKYNFITFIPKSLLIQFARLPNIYFLATAIIQSIPLISPLTSVTAIVPLLFVLMVAMIRDLIEDLSRLTYDRLNNNEEVRIYREGRFIKGTSASINVGEVILLVENEQIPSDMILIDSSLNEGMAFVETSSLDGEKNLKPKIANKNLCGFFKNNLNSPEEKVSLCKNFYGMKIEGFCQCDYPNSDLHKLDGRINISLRIKKNSKNLMVEEGEEIKEINNMQFPITQIQMLLKGSILKNTDWIIGIALYTGMNNKIILNSKMPRTKISLIEKKMNKYLIGIFIILMILCLISSFIHHEKYKEHKVFYEQYILLERSINMESFITFFTYFLLLNTLIPISLIITMEIVKITQGIFISWDVEMYSKIRHKFAKAKTVSINEELGNVNYIFSDKTGTLTSNKMEFKYCVIYGKCYEYDRKLKEINNIVKENNYTNEEIFSNKNFKKKSFPITKIPRNYFINLLQKNMNVSPNISTEYNVNDTSFIDRESHIIYEFWTAIAIAHECVCTKVSEYSGVSPDDVELVKTAYEQGFTFLQSENDLREIRIGDVIQSFKVLNVLNFSSERKRMSVIIRDKNNIIKLYSKGADCEISKRMSKNSKDDPYSIFTLKCVDKLSCKGYRSLLIAYKIINEDEYTKWNQKLKSGEMDLTKKAKIVDECYNEIEQNLELIGATMVEDKLQDKVPETIKDLRMAGIKIWVLTGDKIDTAENIALSCNLISKQQQIFRIFIHHGDTQRSKKDVFPEISNFFREFTVYENGNKSENNNNNSNSQINFSNAQNKNHKNNITNNLSISNHQNNFNNNNINNDGSALNILSNNGGSLVSNNIGCNCGIFNINVNSISYKNNENNYYDTYKQSPFSIIIESPILNGIFADEENTRKFLNIAIRASTVICCRVSPLQKSLVVKKLKKHDKTAITLAIGDGGNDVSMIMEAHLGIGIYGEEGMRAVQASDFAIGEFKFLRRLLFFHGRTNSNRISKMIIYFFYKNFVFSVVQFVYAFFCMGSGQTIIDDWFITCYNLVFTALPLGVQAVTDFDVLESDSETVQKFMPLLYRESREIFPIFSLFKFSFNLIKGFIFAFLIFYLVCFSDVGRIINKEGDYGTLWYMSLKTYTNIIISVNCTLFLSMRYITFLFPLIMGVSSFMLYCIFLVFVEYMTLFNSCGAIFHTLSTSQFYFAGFLVSSMSFLADYMIESISFNFNNSISCNLQKNNFGNFESSSIMGSMIEKRDMISKIFQINSNLENKAISKLSDFSLSKTDGNIEDKIKTNSIIGRNKSMKNNNNNNNNFSFDEEKHKNKRLSEALDYNNKFKEDIFEDKTSNMYLPNSKWIINSHLNIKNSEKKVKALPFNFES